MSRISYATSRLAFHRLVSLPAYRPGITEVVNRVQPQTTAGKLTGRWCLRYACGVASVAIAFVAFVLMTSSVAVASGVPSPGWLVDSTSAPSNFSVSEGGAFEVEVTNVGSVATVEGVASVITDIVPEGLVVTGVAGSGECKTAGRVVRCVIPSVVAAEETLHLKISVGVTNPSVGVVTNRVAMSGGGAREVSAESSGRVSSSPPGFGASAFSFFIDGLDGARDALAGDHPYELTTTIDLNTDVQTHQELGAVVTSVHDVKDVVVDLPLGFVGSTLAAPECTLAQLASEARCPNDTIVGHLRTEPNGEESANSPFWNMVPEHGVPAEFGYVDNHHNTHVDYTHVVPTAEGYVLQFRALEIPQVILSRIIATFYGDPAARDSTGNAEIPFFTNPTACESSPVVATLFMDSWEQPGKLNPDGTPDLSAPGWATATSSSPPVTGCDELSFSPELVTQPTTHAADTPSGMELEMKLPQTENVGVRATPALKDASVRFPVGMTLDPSSGNGLGACSEAQIGWEGPTVFDFNTKAPECPEASKIGSLELTTPLIQGVLHGEIYLATQNQNPFGATLAGYIVVNDPVTGVLLKIPGEFRTDPQTGQITGVFNENPQLPFSVLQLHFFGGPRATLATPDSCGTFTSSSDLAPWSAPYSGPDATPFDAFVVDEGCVGGFSPTFIGGSTNLQASAFTTFIASFERQDKDQELAGASITLPPGLLANVGSVPECGDAEIAAARAASGGCPEASKVGTVQAFAGPGPNPLQATGSAYLTGPYNGKGACTVGESECAPFGLAVIVPAIAGPFNFGNVVVRQRLEIDPYTAQVTDVSDAFPTILNPTGPNGATDGVLIKLRRVDVVIDRPSFAFNPSGCKKQAVTASLSSTRGAVSALNKPFQVTNCGALKFQPQFSVTTSGQTSKADGASLTAKLTYPNVPQGTETNIGLVKVELPKALPSRLTTLQKACTSAQFELNPAGCPAASKIGMAVVHTPLLAVPVEGPAIFVSHGGEAFPSLTMVLQGDGVTIDVVGTTFISKSGITSTTFKTVPDTPFSSFELTLPEGPYSALAANGNLCQQKLVMPTEFVAQDGVELHQNTAIVPTGCKPAIYVTAHKVKGKSTTITVSVPEAGKLVATSKGLSKTSKTSKGAGTVTVKLTLTKHEITILRKHKGRKLKAKINLTFTPKHGPKLKTNSTVLIG